jgi:palmitoyl-[glycerolipid] 3-(E)-desaturase
MVTFHTYGEDSIAVLNKKVARIMEDIKTSKSENPMKGNAEAIAAVRAGAIVYQQRSRLAVAAYALIIAACLVNSPSLGFTLFSLVVMAFVVDLYGAVLHVVLDHPSFVDYPIIGPGCLEFQWHHAIPTDIVSKPFVEVCGDLNLVALLHLAWVVVINGGVGNNAANVMAASKLIMAYLGQWAHRQAHTPMAFRPQWVVSAQWAGLLVCPKLHQSHHTNYDDGFPILNGWSAPLVAWLNRVMPNRHAWLALFAIMSLGDVWLLTKLSQGAFGFM